MTTQLNIAVIPSRNTIPPSRKRLRRDGVCEKTGTEYGIGVDIDSLSRAIHGIVCEMAEERVDPQTAINEATEARINMLFI
ncbi:MAG: hypothetical protein K5882_03250 [Bacteroidales bacterium]|nr:hypothetical protein [Bacteroidales bacterium]